MKKRIFKQQPIKNSRNMDHRKTIYRNTKHRAGKAAMLLVLSLLAGSILPVHGREAEVPRAEEAKMEVSDRGIAEAGATETEATEAPKVVVTEIYHRHIGSPSVKGGCYQTEIPHVHDGDAISGGACFREEQKHVHQGDAASGTGCYTKPILHTHQGNEGQAGECYSAVYHSHEGGCYKNEICTIKYTKGDVIEVFTEECDTCGETTFDRASGIGSHKNCGTGDEDVVLEYCQICGPMSYSYHTYPTVICGIDTEQPVEYEKTCGMEEGDVEGYETGCDLAEDQVESYKRTCEKLLDGYSRSCGLDEDTPCGRMTVTNETEGKQEKVTVSVKFEDLSEGKLILGEPPFNWFDESGKNIGQGDQIEVEENGNYTVELNLQNRDVDEGGLRSSMFVDNVLKNLSGDGEKTPSPTVSPSPSSGKDDQKPSPTPNQTPGKDSSGDEGDQGDNGDSSGGEENPTPFPSATPIPPGNPVTEDRGDDKGGRDNGIGTKAADLSEEKMDGGGEGADTSDKNVLKKETVQKKLPGNMDAAPDLPEVKEVSSFKRFFAIPAVRVITVAAGTLLFLTGLFLLLLYLRKSVRLYNDDGAGGFISLGRMTVRLEEEGYAVTISEKAEEKAYTNRYCIKPGLFRLGKSGQEIFVYKDTGRISVALEREMIFVL